MALKIATDTYIKKNEIHNPRPLRSKPPLLPVLMLLMMLGVILSGGALLSYTLGIAWIPALLLEHLPLVRTLVGHATLDSLNLIGKQAGTSTLIVMFFAAFTLYLLALRFLPRLLSHRFMMFSTLILGMAFLTIPIVTSQDMFSYIAYARMGTIYHLNPLTTLPTSIRTDPIYGLIYWTNQPSAYGPVWAIISCSLQWIDLLFGFRNVLSMELLLRLFGLAMLLGATQLIWLISGHLQGRFGATVYGVRQRRRALLAFAWNPFLLFEACVNAHTDITILFFVLLALWMLLDRMDGTRERTSLAAGGDIRSWRSAFQLPRLFGGRGSIELAALMLALASSIKITMVLLLPGLLLYLWTRQGDDIYGRSRMREVLTATGVYMGVIILLYAPFWQHGAILQLLRVSPVMILDVNSPYQFVISMIASLRGTTVPNVQVAGISLLAISHTVSMALLAITYGGLCIWSLRKPRFVNTIPMLIRWMALAEILYCVVGSPWFWPWYTIPLFGLLALIEADGRMNMRLPSVFRSFPVGTFTRILALSMFSLYTFGKWKPTAGTLPLLAKLRLLNAQGYFPLLYHFRLDYLNGIVIWLLPVVVIGAEWVMRHRNSTRQAAQQS